MKMVSHLQIPCVFLWSFAADITDLVDIHSPVRRLHAEYILRQSQILAVRSVCQVLLQQEI